MSISLQEATTLSPDVYAWVEQDVFEIRSKLDPAALEEVAREVLRRVAQKASAVDPNDTPATREELELLCALLISAKPDSGLEFIERIRADGASIETVYLSYLGGAAQLMGEWWEQDRVSFFDVTVGSGRIYAIMCALNAKTVATVAAPAARRSALFASVPGETHNLGVKAAANLLEQRGWSTVLLVARSHDELIEEIIASSVPFVGLSAAGAHALPAMTKLIISLRIEDPAKRIIVGGNILAESENEIHAMKPDAVAIDMPQAYAVLERMWRRMQHLAM